MMTLHVHRYDSCIALNGSHLYYSTDGSFDGLPFPRKASEIQPDDKLISCQDCDEPAIIIGRISYDQGWNDRYCENCAWIHLNYREVI